VASFSHGAQGAGAARQKTLRTSIGCVGVGLHSGLKVGLTLKPAEPDTGIRIVRHDLPGARPMAARYDRVIDTTLCTTIADAGGTRVATVEHLMAALAACEIDNARIELSGPEVPIMDGSAQPFLFLIECAGIVEQERPRRLIEILEPVEARDGERFARLEPADGFEVACTIDFAHEAIGRQERALAFAPDAFKQEIAAARTFGFAERVEELWARGLALGGSLKNAVVISRDRVLNEEGLRFPDEFVRHKLLDMVGDLYLAGAPIKGRLVGHCSGHGLHNRLLHALFATPTAYRETGAPPSLPSFEEARRSAATA
jgi:UDP-3-O-[3-hydroxymyristoyl] N-acetylglucosamine deacetylase